MRVKGSYMISGTFRMAFSRWVWSGVQARLGVLEAVRVAPLRDWVGASGRGVGAQGDGQGASLFLCELQDVVLYMWVFDEDAFLSDDNFGLGFRLARARISLCPRRCLSYCKLSRGGDWP